MKLTVVCVCSLLFIFSVSLPAQEVLNNESILKLVKAGISDDTIVSMVYQQVGKYALSADDMAALKSGGVSERIIAAMVIKSASSPTVSSKSTSQAQPQWKDR